MALSTIGRNQLNTGIDDNSDATAVVIDSSERVGVGVTPNATFGSHLYVQGTPAANKPILSVYSQGNSNNAGIAILNDAGNKGIWTESGNLRFTTTYEGNSTTQMNIDSSGRVTMAQQPSFQARSNISNLALTGYAGTTTHLNAFNAEYFDIGNNYDTSTSTYTAPVAGRYYFYVQLQINGPTTSNHSWGINLHFQVNGAGNHANGYQSVSNSAGSLFGAYGLAVKENILNLSASDTVRVALSGETNLNAGTIETATNDGRCRFGGHLLG